MLEYASETWDQVKDEFDELGRRNFEECKIADGKKPYALQREAWDWMGKNGLIHVTTARDEGKLVGYSLTILAPRHLQFDAFASQGTGLYLKPEYRKGFNASRLLDEDEIFLQQLGVQLGYRDVAMDPDVGPLLERKGWVKKEVIYTKWIGELNG